jgi:acetyltransferase-like isoleucine patch superfamily enzyme
MLKTWAKKYLPDEILQIYRSYLQKRLENLSSIPSADDVLQVGAYTYGTDNLKILFRDSGEKVEIGKFCSIARDVTIFLGGGHRHDWVSTYPFGHIEIQVFGEEKSAGHPSSNGSVVIGNDVWIGHGVTIMSGINIGDGAVVASNSHVVSDIPAYGIVGGNPAKIIRMRFENDTISRLLAIKWWDFPTSEIKLTKGQLCHEPSDDVLSALEIVRKRISQRDL